ncbi:MAG: penicillin-binding protein activator [Candidatus Sumerlaeota bacterium]|nr:penicillin-binding protein activator [Candidatus Sumerlaeota bacterium]
MKLQRRSLPTVFALAIVVLSIGCKKESFEIRDVDPGKAGVVRSLGPESQDARRVAELMVRSLLADPTIAASDYPPTIAMLPMENNSRFPFNKDIFTTLLEAELNKAANGRLRFVARDILDDVEAERQGKREGDLDYDPTRRTRALAGVDYFLKGRVDGQSWASSKGQAEYAVYAFRLIDAESSIVLWQDVMDVKKEGKDDVIYR